LTPLVEDFDAISGRLREIQKDRLCDCRGQFGHAHDCAIFKCSVCGSICDTSPNDGPTFCPLHCPDHDYQHQRGEGHMCVTCGAPPPDDWGVF
jgi:hypothetical protein